MTNHHLRRQVDYWRKEAEHQAAMKETYKRMVQATARRFWLAISMMLVASVATVIIGSGWAR